MGITNEDWFYDQGSPEPEEELDEDEEVIEPCNYCGYLPCACDEPYEYERDYR